MARVVELNEIEILSRSGTTVMSGGFLGNGASDYIIDYMIRAGAADLSLISSDTAFPDRGAGRLIAERRVRRLVASHIGTNPETGRQMAEGLLEVELVPQGTLCERIRAGGFGLGGILTKTGVGTVVQEGKRVVEVDGERYLLELPLRAEIAILKGSVVDAAGNVLYRGTTQNFNPAMAMAAEIVVVEAEELVPIGDIRPECVMTPGSLVDYIVHDRRKET